MQKLSDVLWSDAIAETITSNEESQSKKELRGGVTGSTISMCCIPHGGVVCAFGCGTIGNK